MQSSESLQRRHDRRSMPQSSILDRAAERRDSIDIVEIVDPLQHHALHTGSFQLSELRRNLFGGADDLAFAPELVGALARQALGKLVVVLAEDHPRHQGAANL